MNPLHHILDLWSVQKTNECNEKGMTGYNTQTFLESRISSYKHLLSMQSSILLKTGTLASLKFRSLLNLLTGCGLQLLCLIFCLTGTY